MVALIFLHMAFKVVNCGNLFSLKNQVKNQKSHTSDVILNKNEILYLVKYKLNSSCYIEIYKGSDLN